MRERRQIWLFGLEPDEVAEFIADYGWRLVEQAGPEELVQRYVEPAGANSKRRNWNGPPRRKDLADSDLDDRRHDHRLATIDFAHPLANRAAHPWAIRIGSVTLLAASDSSSASTLRTAGSRPWVFGESA